MNYTFFLNNRAITNDRLSPEPDGDLLTSAMIVNRIRLTMNDTPSVNVPIQAYIIPSADAHQVSSDYIYK